VFLTITFRVARDYGQSTWDWLKILLIPAVIALGGFLLNRAQSQRDQQIASERAQDEALQGYLDGMPELLTGKEQTLHRAQPGDSLSTVARARTLTLLSRLDSARKRSVLEFLYEASLIDLGQTFISLEQADLSGSDLNGANLIRADLSGANLSWEADLIDAILSGAKPRGEADLRDADLRDANLSDANLREADLSYDKLSSANLQGANLTDANLTGANLSNAKVTSEQLAEAKSLEGATMPNDQKYEDWLKGTEKRQQDE